MDAKFISDSIAIENPTNGLSALHEKKWKIKSHNLRRTSELRLVLIAMLLNGCKSGKKCCFGITGPYEFRSGPPFIQHQKMPAGKLMKINWLFNGFISYWNPRRHWKKAETKPHIRSLRLRQAHSINNPKLCLEFGLVPPLLFWLCFRETSFPGPYPVN